MERKQLAIGRVGARGSAGSASAQGGGVPPSAGRGGMSSARLTRLLVLLLVAAGAAAAVCRVRTDALRQNAAVAARDLSRCQRYASELASGGAVAAAPEASSAGGDPDFNRRMRDAAAAAGIPDRLIGVEPGEPRRLPGGAYDEMLVFLRFDAVSLKDLTTFLHRLAEVDPGSRAKSVELAPTPEPAASPGGAAPAGTELWTADVTLSYLLRAARQRPTGVTAQERIESGD